MATRKSNNHRRRREERHFRVRGVRRDPPDMRKLGKALISLAQAEAERQARAEYEARQSQPDDLQERPAEPAEGSDA